MNDEGRAFAEPLIFNRHDLWPPGIMAKTNDQDTTNPQGFKNPEGLDKK
jgi:hypothetical protein